MPGIPSKRCKTCRHMRPLDEFYKNPKSRDGLSYDCRHCNLEKQRKYLERHKVSAVASRMDVVVDLAKRRDAARAANDAIALARIEREYKRHGMLREAARTRRMI